MMNINGQKLYLAHIIIFSHEDGHTSTEQTHRIVWAEDSDHCEDKLHREYIRSWSPTDYKDVIILSITEAL
jgi:hypothetical protein